MSIVGSRPSISTNFVNDFNYMRDSLMVRCQAHNLETVIACEGSNPSPATIKKHYNESSERYAVSGSNPHEGM